MKKSIRFYLLDKKKSYKNIRLHDLLKILKNAKIIDDKVSGSSLILYKWETYLHCLE